MIVTREDDDGALAAGIITGVGRVSGRECVIALSVAANAPLDDLRYGTSGCDAGV